MPGSLEDKFIGNKLDVTQSTGTPGAKTIGGLDQLLLVLPEKPTAATWSDVPDGDDLKALLGKRTAGSVPAISTRVNNKRRTAVHLGTLDAAASPFERLTFARKMVNGALGEKAGKLGIWVRGFDAGDAETITRELLAAALAAGFALPEWKSEPSPAKIASIRILGLDGRLDLKRQLAESQGNNLARWLTALPPNKLDAREYTAFLKNLSRQYGWQFRKYGVGDLEKLGAGAFLAVAQGNADDSAAIVRLRYRPGSARSAARLALVGKGIIFDTGGNNLKPFQSMLDMHIDMGGSAVAVGTLLALTEAGFDEAVDCWLAITENRIGPTAYKPQDVITALNGKTIQTIHTDAEGRMALADTLTLACQDKPGMIIDYATLTGACVNAVTTRMSGVFTNKPDLHPVLKKGGYQSGERVWPFPIGKEYLEDLKSDVADIKQCAPNGGGDHILAGSFLNEFVDDDVPWVHVDLSAISRKGGLAHMPTEITGFGVRLTLHLVLDANLLDPDSWKRKTE